MQPGAAAAVAMLIGWLAGTMPVAAYELASTADPLAREIVATCSAAIAARALPTDDAWQVGGPIGREAINENPGTLYANRDMAGVGRLHLRLHASVVDSDQLSSCGITIANPQKQFSIADFGTTEGLLGSVDGDKGVWFAGDSKLFVSVLQQPTIFSFSMEEIADASP